MVSGDGATEGGTQCGTYAVVASPSSSMAAGAAVVGEVGAVAVEGLVFAVFSRLKTLLMRFTYLPRLLRWFPSFASFVSGGGAEAWADMARCRGRGSRSSGRWMPVVSFGETIPRLCVCGGHWSDMQAPMVRGLAETGAKRRDDRQGGSEAAVRRLGGLAAGGARAELSLGVRRVEEEEAAAGTRGLDDGRQQSSDRALSGGEDGGRESGQLCRRTSSVGSFDPELQASLKSC